MEYLSQRRFDRGDDERNFARLPETQPFRIGGDALGTPNFMQGWIDEFRVSNVARWPAAFTPAIGPYSSSSDVLVISRAQKNTPASTHKAQDRVQLCLVYSGVSPDLIIADLLTSYTAVDPSNIPAADWAAEIKAYLNRVYSATIAQPTSVNTLISELIEQAGLSMWWNDRDQEIGLLVLRGLIYSNYYFDETNMIADTLEIEDQPDKRLSQVHTYFGQINPLTSLTDTVNYRSVSLISDTAAESDYGSPAIQEIFSRWIPQFGRSVADRLGNILLSRFKDAPRKITFSLLRGSTTAEIVLANGYQVSAWPLQDETGAKQIVNIQVTRLRPNPDTLDIESEEVLFPVSAPEDLSVRNIIVDANTHNINLRSAHDLIFPAPTAGIKVILTINAGAIIGSTNTILRALEIGTWPAGVEIILNVLGRIEGMGGRAGGIDPQRAGLAGGPALYTRQAIKLACPGQVYGGGGGGGGAATTDGSGNDYFWGGGGGAGFDPGAGGTGGGSAGAANGSPGTPDAGGAQNAYAGHGGGPGAAGGQGGGVPSGGVAYVGGAAGAAIDGNSFVTTGTWDGTTFTPGAITGTILGPKIN